VSIKGLQAIAFLLVAGLLIGFSSYAGRVSSWDAPVAAQADAIVVLTGDEGRLAAGGALLRDGHAPVMLISGVHSSVSNTDILQYTGLDTAMLDCCVSLGRQAHDTVGNANETANWVDANGFDRLIVVTSDYHMPRSLLVMQRALPDTELVAYPVRTSPPWQRPASLRLWVLEFAKYAMVWLSQTGSN